MVTQAQPIQKQDDKQQREMAPNENVFIQEKVETRKRMYSHSTLGLSSWNSRPLQRHPHNIDAGDCFGADFGGTLTKVVFFEPDEIPGNALELANLLKSKVRYGTTGFRDTHLSFHSQKLGGTFHFIRFESSRTKGAIDLLRQLPKHNIETLHSTGGGAHKFSDIFKKELGITLIKEDELETVVRGIVFTLLEHPTGECYSYEPKATRNTFRAQSEVQTDLKKIFRPMPVADGSLFPLIVVNIGSGVSLIKVDSPNSFHRISGTAIGGATYYGLAKLLTRCTSYDDAMDHADKGDSRRVNLLVEDIYGGSYDRVGLPGEMTAAFFGKAAATHGSSRPASSSRSGISKRSLIKRYLKCIIRKKERIIQIGTILTCLIAVLINLGVSYGFIAINDQSWIQVLKSSAVLPFILLITYMYHTSGPSSDFSKRDDPLAHEEVFLDEDICRALVVMVAQNVTQIAYLNARIHNSTRVVFTGNFLRHNEIAMRTLSNSLRIWSKGEIHALFMEHEGYFGAMGTFLYSMGLDAKGDDEDIRKNSLDAQQ